MFKFKFKAILLTVLMIAAGNASAYWGESYVTKLSNLNKKQIIQGLGYATMLIPALLFVRYEASPESALYARLAIAGWLGYGVSRLA